MPLGTVRGIDSIEIHSILETRHPCYEEFTAVRAPERNAEILVLSRIEIGPCYSCIIKIHDTYTHLRVGLAALRVSCLAE